MAREEWNAANYEIPHKKNVCGSLMTKSLVKLKEKYQNIKIGFTKKPTARGSKNRSKSISKKSSSIKIEDGSKNTTQMGGDALEHDSIQMA